MARRGVSATARRTAGVDDGESEAEEDGRATARRTAGGGEEDGG